MEYIKSRKPVIAVAAIFGSLTAFAFATGNTGLPLQSSIIGLIAAGIMWRYANLKPGKGLVSR